MLDLLVPIYSNPIMFAHDLCHGQIVTFGLNASFTSTSTFTCTLGILRKELAQIDLNVKPLSHFIFDLFARFLKQEPDHLVMIRYLYKRKYDEIAKSMIALLKSGRKRSGVMG